MPKLSVPFIILSHYFIKFSQVEGRFNTEKTHVSAVLIAMERKQRSRLPKEKRLLFVKPNRLFQNTMALFSILPALFSNTPALFSNTPALFSNTPSLLIIAPALLKSVPAF